MTRLGTGTGPTRATAEQSVTGSRDRAVLDPRSLDSNAGQLVGSQVSSDSNGESGSCDLVESDAGDPTERKPVKA